MRIVTVWILLASVLLSGAIGLAQNEIDLEYLYVNNPYDDNYFCTAEQALEFYDALDGFPGLVEAIEKIRTGTALMVWNLLFTSWYESAEQDCYGAGNMTVELEHQARYIAIQHMSGEEAELPEENAYSLALAMSTADRELLDRDETASDYDLEINRAIVEVPYCTVEEAIVFYSSFGGFLEASGAMTAVSDQDSLKDWATQYFEWSGENWAPLLEEPCGQLPSLIAFLESFAFGAALAQLTAAGEVSIETFNENMNILDGWIAEEVVWLEEYLDE
ncbi:MAG: hypothetical protein OXG53_11170 [Chloroflexi bacterium]|nr:hypothetical protein [Chloroflexota bacterium]